MSLEKVFRRSNFVQKLGPLKNGVIVKINGKFYELWVARPGKKWWRFRCRSHRTGCGFTLQMKSRNKDPNHPDFWKRENWELTSGNSGSLRRFHTCEGISDSELTSQQFHNFVRKNLNQGITDYETIRIKSKIDEKYAENASLYIKAPRNYRMAIKHHRKKLGNPDISKLQKSLES